MRYGESVFPVMPQDEKAFVFTPDAFGAIPDGTGDNTKALQSAIDTLVDTMTRGIIFIPEGTYLFCGTVNLWRGVKLIGVGAKRPRFVLADNADGFGGPLSRYLIFCRNIKPQPGEYLRDANETTFYTSLRNIDVDLGQGNHGAVALRYHVAQLCPIEDCDFYLNDAKAGLEEGGNEVERCRFFGGTYGLISHHTAPGWQYYVGDCVFDGQKRACIMTNQAGMTLVRTTMRNAPWGVYVPNKELYDAPLNETERLYMENCRAENMSTAVVSMGWLRNPVNWLHATGTICRNAPMFLEAFGYQFVYFFLEPPITTEYPCYQVESHIGLRVNARNQVMERKFAYDYEITPAQWSEAPDPLHREVPPVTEWRSVREFGAVGDGVTDDTAAFEQAIAQCDSVYVPMGEYRLSRGLVLKADTALIGLHPGNTTLILDDMVYTDPEADGALLRIGQDGHNIVAGLGFDGGKNRGISTVLWQGAEDSLMEECQFCRKLIGTQNNAVNSRKPAEELKKERSRKRLGRDQQHTLWIRGGAGIFKNIWSNDNYAQDGLYLSDTNKPGRMYMMSIEHHSEVEVRLDRVQNWAFISLQTEDAYLNDFTTSIICDHCEDCLFANLFEYRMQSFEVPFPYAIRLNQCRWMNFWGVHAYSGGPNPWENAALLVESGGVVKDREIGTLLVNHG